MNAMKIIFVALTLVASQSFAEEKVDTEAAKEYFKHAGQATDPAYQDYVSTSQQSDKKEKTTDTSYTDQQKKIKDRVDNSPKYTVPYTGARGAYGQAK